MRAFRQLIGIQFKMAAIDALPAHFHHGADCGLPDIGPIRVRIQGGIVKHAAIGAHGRYLHIQVILLGNFRQCATTRIHIMADQATNCRAQGGANQAAFIRVLELITDHQPRNCTDGNAGITCIIRTRVFAGKGFFK